MVCWGAHENARLRQLIDSGVIDINNLDAQVLFDHTSAHFPGFTGEGAAGRRTAIQRLQRLLNRIRVERDLQGVRGAENEREGA